MRVYFVEIQIGKDEIESGIAIDFGDFTVFNGEWDYEYHRTFQDFKESLVYDYKLLNKLVQITELK